MGEKVQPFLMFHGQAEAAMEFYVSQFPGAAIVEVVRYAPGVSGVEGAVMRGVFTIGGQTIVCTDSIVQHDFTFTPAFSLFVNCDAEDELRRLATNLAQGGATLMALGDYGFSRQFAFVTDRFGVSWQLNLA